MDLDDSQNGTLLCVGCIGCVLYLGLAASFAWSIALAVIGIMDIDACPSPESVSVPNAIPLWAIVAGFVSLGPTIVRIVFTLMRAITKEESDLVDTMWTAIEKFLNVVTSLNVIFLLVWSVFGIIWTDRCDDACQLTCKDRTFNLVRNSSIALCVLSALGVFALLCQGWSRKNSSESVA